MTKGYIFDLDGTVYLEGRPIDGACETIEYLRNNGDKVLFLTNNPANTRVAYVEKLNNMGVKADLSEVINSGLVTAMHLKKILNPGDLVWVIGEVPLYEELEALSIPITHDPLKATHVLVSWDRDFTYKKLSQAFNAWKNGATFLATNPDRTCPVVGGQVPDCGAIIGAIEGATGGKIDQIIGKPSKIMASVAAEYLNLSYEECIMVGDRLETDIKMGNDVGMETILVLSGITDQEALQNSKTKPTYVMNSIKEIPSSSVLQNQ